MDTSYVPVVRFLSEAEAYPLAGWLRADGIEARVVRQAESFYAYGQVQRFMILVPEPDAARAVWMLDHVGGSSDAKGP